ncbi:MAG: aminomethyltransferase family protein [Chloroflexi bacterium]|nr:aminomethyltransferase family protein [Chloroflexota bacterium]
MVERRSPFYDYHLRHAGQLVKGGGDYMFPVAYTSGVDEHLNTRTNVGMQDISSMGEVDIKGPGAERLINRLVVNEITNMEPGQMRYTTMCNENGGIVDDITVYKFNDEHFMIVTSSAPRKQAVRWLAEHALGSSTYVTEISGAVALVVLQGPRSREFLRTVVEEIDLNPLPFFRFTPTVINDTELLLSRSGYTGELGYELYIPAEDAGGVWEFLLKQGKPFGLQPYGVLAMQSLRMEKAFPLYGPDISVDVTPFHVGLDRWIRFDKREFVGRDALLRVQETGIQERWVGLILEGNAPANANDPIHTISDVASFRRKKRSGSEAGEATDAAAPGEPIGRITSSTKGHSVDKMLAFGYVRTSHAWPGSKLLVMTGGRPVVATVTQTPFFDPAGARMRAKATDNPNRVATKPVAQNK